MRFASRTASWHQQNGLSDERDYSRLVGDGSANSIVNACLLWMVRSFPEAPPALWEVNDANVRNRVARHPLIRLLKYPTATPEKVGGYYSGVLLWMATLTSWIIDGNAYWLKVRSAYQRPVQLWYVPHWMMEPRWSPDGSDYVSHYDYRVDGQVLPIDPSNVVHFRHGLDPDNTRKGKAPLAAVLREVYTDEEAARFTASILKNFGMPGLVVSPDMVLGGSAGNFRPPEMDTQAMKKRFKEEFGGDQRGAPFVSNLPIKLQEFGFSPQQLDLTALRHVPEQRVTATLGLPAAVVGFGAGLQHTKVGATMAEMRDQAWQSSLIPNQRLMASEVQIQLLPDFETDLEKYEFGFDTSQVKVLQDDKLKLADVWGTLYSRGIAMLDEARAPFELSSGPEDHHYIPVPVATGTVSRPGRGSGNPGDAPADGDTPGNA
jgi:phage portal protein BeeE